MRLGTYNFGGVSGRVAGNKNRVHDRTMVLLDHFPISVGRAHKLAARAWGRSLTINHAGHLVQLLGADVRAMREAEVDLH